MAAADDATAALSNPALLTSLTRFDAFGGLALLGSGRAPLGDDVGRSTALAASGLAGRLSNRWAILAAVVQPRAVQIDVLPVRLSDGSADVGALDARVTDLVLAGAFKPTARLHLGALLVRTGTHLEGDYRHDLADGSTDVNVHATGTSWRVTGGFGLLYEAGRVVTLGVSTLAGVRYPLTRSAESPVLQATLDSGSPFELVRPAVVSAGGTWRPSVRLVVGAQVDYVSYSDVPAALTIGLGARSRDEYRLADALEPHLGAEYSIPLRGLSLQVRAGLQLQAGGRLRFEGDDAAEASAYPGDGSQAVGSLGLSLVSGRGLRLDLAGRLGGERPAFLLGVMTRF